MRLTRLNWSFVLLLLVFACGQKMTVEQMRAKAKDYVEKEQWQDAIDVYEKLLNTYPDSRWAPESLYKLGDLYATYDQQFEKSVRAYQKLIERYPDSKYNMQASFMIGYRYANDIKDLEKARESYELFLATWPDHELSPSVRWELKYLGQDISDIDLEFEPSGETTQ